MKNNTIIVILVILTLSALIMMYDTISVSITPMKKNDAEENTKFISSNLNEKVPDFTFKNLDGKGFSIEDFRGKVVMLNFWASWCLPCKKEFPSMLRLMKYFDGEVVFVAVSTDMKLSSIQYFLKSFETEFSSEINSQNLHVVWDEKHDISQDLFHVLRMPETIIIDRQGNMVRKVVGDIHWDSEKTLNYFRKLLR